MEHFKKMNFVGDKAVEEQLDAFKREFLDVFPTEFLGITKDVVKDTIKDLGAGTNPELDPIEAITNLLKSGHGPEIAFMTKLGKEARFFLYNSEEGTGTTILKTGSMPSSTKTICGKRNLLPSSPA